METSRDPTPRPSVERQPLGPVAPYDHDELVRDLAEVLAVGEFGTVHASAGPYARPAPVFNETDAAEKPYFPDVTAAARNGCVELFAVETPTTLWEASTARTWRALAKAARRSGRFRPCALWVVVRRPLRSAVIRRLGELRIRARVLAI